MKKPNGSMFLDGQHIGDCYVYAERAENGAMEICVRGTPKPMSIYQKYNHAILVLQAISQRSGGYKGGGWDEWSEAGAFRDCQEAAERALKYLGEPAIMPNKAKEGNVEAGKGEDMTKKQRDEERQTMYLAAAVIKGICTSRTEDNACASCPFYSMCGTEPYTWEIPGEGS